jgi:galactokinase
MTAVNRVPTSETGRRTNERDALVAKARAACVARFGEEPTVLGCAPGRVELLGNHTDYNGGLVIAAAIDRFTVVAGCRSAQVSAQVASEDFQEVDTFSLEAIERTDSGAWTRYVRGVCWALSAWRGPPNAGFVAAIAGNVPLGAGLSSSASLQASLACFMIQAGLFADQLSQELRSEPNDVARMELAQTLRRSENEFVGVGSGLLDQFSSLFGRDGCVLFLDCDTLIHDRLPLGTLPPAIVVCDSKTSRRLADGMYDQRRAETERVTAYFREKMPHRREFYLSWLTLDQLEGEWSALDPIGRKRARHVLSENARVREGLEVLKRGDVAAFGRLMSASHASSRDDFGNSSDALDSLIECAESAPGFLGGKLSGAGWAGCTVNLVLADRSQEFAETVRSGYFRKTGIVPEIHICRAADGAFARDLVASASRDRANVT